MARNEPKIYHGSNVKSIITKIVAIILAAAVILTLTAFFGFRKFIAYTDTGKLYLDIPWLYGYMDGPPETDDLAPYFAPIEEAHTTESFTKNDENETNNVNIPDTNDDISDTNSNSTSNVPQYVAPENP